MSKVRLRYSLLDAVALKSVSGDVELLLGYSADEFIDGSMTLENIIHIEDRDIYQMLCSSDENTRVFDSTNLRLRDKNGRIKCVKINYEKYQEKNLPGLILELILQDATLLNNDLSDQVLLSNFQTMMENTNDYIYFKDRNHVFIGVSQTLVNLINSSKYESDLIGITDYDIFSEALADKYYRLEKQIFNAELAVVKEIQPTLDNKGKKVWLDTQKYPIKDHDGNIIGVFCIARDITQQVKEKAWAETAHYTRSLIESSLDPLVTITIDGAITDVNFATEKMTGFTKKQLIGTDFSDCFTEPQRAIVGYIEAYQKGSIRDYFLEIKHKAGYSTPVIYNATVYKDPQGYVLGVFATVRDISLQIETENKLSIALDASNKSNKELKNKLIINQQLNQQLKLIASVFNSSDPIMITNEKTEIIKVNKAFKVLTGYEEQELLGEKPSLFHSGRQDKSFYENIWMEIQEKGRWAGEITNRKKNGDLFLAWLSISQIKDNAGNVVNYFSHLNDITQYKNTQSALTRRLNMEEMISEIAIQVLGANNKKVNEIINNCLMLLGRELLADYCCLLRIDNNFKFYKSHEWCIEGLESDITDLLNITTEKSFFLINEYLFMPQVIKIDDVDDVDDIDDIDDVGDVGDIDDRLVKAISEQLEWRGKKIQSLLIVPITDSDNGWTFLALARMKEKRAWRHEDISLLKVTANIFYLALYRQKIEQENRRLLTSIISTQEKERRYLAQELHDEMGQLLTAMHMDASYLQTFESIKQDEDAFERIVAIDKLSTKVISRLRITTRRIRTATLDQLGLVAAIKELLTDWKAYNHSIIITLSLIDKIDKVSEDVMLTFYRVLQEGLTNISKYAKANNVYICLDELNDNGRKSLSLILSDDGIGIITKHKRSEGAGLLGMKERVRAVEGTINITPNKNNRGTQIEIKVPLG